MNPEDKALVALAIASARNCLHIFEEQYPHDDRPRKALESAEQWLLDPKIERRTAAELAELKVWRSRD